MKYLIRALEREGVRTGDKPRTPAPEAPAGEAARTADLPKTDLEPITDDELKRMLGSGAACRFSYSPGEAPVAAATAPGADASRGVIKLHGKLAPMAVRYQTLVGEGFELSGDDVKVVASALEAGSGDEPREAEARLEIGKDLEVGYAGFYTCSP